MQNYPPAYFGGVIIVTLYYLQIISIITIILHIIVRVAGSIWRFIVAQVESKPFTGVRQKKSTSQE